MKNVTTPKSILRILGIIACVAVIITMTACEGPEGPTGPAGPAGANGANGADGANGAQGPIGPSNVYTVTFLMPADATQVPSQKVLETQFAYDPSYLMTVRKPIPTPATMTAGLYKGASLVGWKKQSGSDPEKVYDDEGRFYSGSGWKDLFNFYYTPITSDITLIPVWIKEKTISLAPSYTLNDVIGAISSEGNGDYLLALGANYSSSNPIKLYRDNVNLTIIGLGSTRTITLTLTGGGTEDESLFVLGKVVPHGGDPDYTACENISLTIGNNIELKGITTGTAQKSPLVQVNPGTTFTMLANSKISNNKNNNQDPGDGTGAGAVEVAGGTFIMKGGTIENITGIMTVNVTGEGVDNETFYGSFVMEGGTITNSTLNMSGFPGVVFDVLIDSRASFNLSGSAAPTVGMVYHEVDDNHPAPFSPISIDPSWSGDSLKLHLMGGSATINSAAKLAGAWSGKTIVDTPLSTTQASKITSGKLILATESPTATDFTGTVSTAGVLTITAPAPVAP